MEQVAKRGYSNLKVDHVNWTYCLLDSTILCELNHQDYVFTIQNQNEAEVLVCGRDGTPKVLGPGKRMTLTTKKSDAKDLKAIVLSVGETALLQVSFIRFRDSEQEKLNARR